MGRPGTGTEGARRLLFFCGHVPKIYVRPTRYLVWRSLQAARHLATTYSADLGCTIGA